MLPKSDLVPDVVSGGGDSVALRVPDHPVPRAIVNLLGCAITGTSANRSGAPSSTTAHEVRRQLGSDVDMVVDGGECRAGLASTVVDVTGPSPRILRQGAVSRAALESVLGMSLPEAAG